MRMTCCWCLREETRLMPVVMKDERDIASEVEVSLTGLVQVHAAGLWRAQQVKTSHGVAGQLLGGCTRPLLQETGAGWHRRCIAGRVDAGATLDWRHIWPARGDKDTRQLWEQARWMPKLIHPKKRMVVGFTPDGGTVEFYEHLLIHRAVDGPF